MIFNICEGFLDFQNNLPQGSFLSFLTRSSQCEIKWQSDRQKSSAILVSILPNGDDNDEDFCLSSFQLLFLSPTSQRRAPSAVNIN
jgi:hypothetical protein